MLTQTESKGKILLALKNDALRTEYAGHLKNLGYDTEQALDHEEIQAISHQMQFDVVLIDDRLAGSRDGFPAVSAMKQEHASLEFLILIENKNKFKYLNAIETGVSDWMPIDFDPDELQAKLERITRDQATRKALISKQRESEKIKVEMDYVLQGLKEMVRGHEGFILPERVKTREEFPEIIGNSQEIEKVLELVRLVAKTNATVLITGESGTGKELITRAIHRRSNRSERPFVPVNCAALSETLLESELFGHEKGAFTGAVTAKQGLIAEAEGGTLFLDEISEMPLSFQVKLLRVLQYGEYKRVGASQMQTADIRIVAATNTSLETMVKKGAFREDLFHRINQFQINVPPLRQRVEDLSMLNQYFLERACLEYDKPLVGFSTKLIEKMYRYAWPGNVRELESMVSQAVILATPPMIELKDMPTLVEKLHKHPRKTRMSDMTYAEAKEAFEKTYFQSVMDRTEGNISAASRLCQMDRKYLREKVRKLKIVTLGSSGRLSTSKTSAS